MGHGAGRRARRRPSVPSRGPLPYWLDDELWVVLLAAALTVVLVVGAGGFEITGYGGRREIVIACAILAGSIVLYLIRRLVQDRERLRLRDRRISPKNDPTEAS